MARHKWSTLASYDKLKSQISALPMSLKSANLKDPKRKELQDEEFYKRFKSNHVCKREEGNKELYLMHYLKAPSESNTT